MPSQRYADLHLHTTASDGTDSLEQRIQQAEEYGLAAIAITDHDTISEELDSRSYEAESGVEVITGAEIKCEIGGTKIEILGYFLNPENAALEQVFEELSENRIQRMEKMVENLNQEIEEDISLEEVLEYEEDTPGRPHLAQVLIDRGVAEDNQHAFDEFIGKESDVYREVEKIPAEKVIEAVHESGGVASLAHPGRSLTKDEAVEKIGHLVKNGLDALEVEYTYRGKIRKSSYDVYFTEVHANRLAEMYDLIPTGGSDCHGIKSDKFNIGKVKLDYENVARLRTVSREYR